MNPFFKRYFLAKPSPQINNTTQTSVKQPISAPSSPNQYRAIGLVRAKYERSPEKINRGWLVDSQGNRIRAVVLAKVISLIRKRLDLSQEHLWVVYPRTDTKTDELHMQIAGVWQPELLHQDASVPIVSDSQLVDRYFSIRAEVVSYDRRSRVVIVKIRQKSRQQGEKPTFFKLKLQGIVPDNSVKHFWDLHVKLEGDKLVIEKATDLGLLPHHQKTKPILKTATTESTTPKPNPKDLILRRSQKISSRNQNT